jgi:hypothetical protein
LESESEDHSLLQTWRPRDSTTSPLRHFFYFGFFNHYFKNKPDETFFLNMTFLSHVNPSGVTYKGVAPVHLARAGVATLAEIVPRRISCAS